MYIVTEGEIEIFRENNQNNNELKKKQFEKI